MSTHALSDIVSAIADAAVSGRRLCEKQHLRMMRDYFIKSDEPGKLIAKTVAIQVPSMRHGVTELETIEVPLITLVPMSSLIPDELAVGFQASFSGLEKEFEKGVGAARGDANAEGDYEDRRGKEDKQMYFSLKGEGDATVDVKLVMKATDPPEGLLRLNDRFIKLIP